jgi:hypothetical protein
LNMLKGKTFNSNGHSTAFYVNVSYSDYFL